VKCRLRLEFPNLCHADIDVKHKRSHASEQNTTFRKLQPELTVVFPNGHFSCQRKSLSTIRQSTKPTSHSRHGAREHQPFPKSPRGRLRALICQPPSVHVKPPSTHHANSHTITLHLHAALRMLVVVQMVPALILQTESPRRHCEIGSFKRQSIEPLKHSEGDAL